MKTISKLLLLIAVVIFASCEGPMGPAGYDGQDGYNILGTVFETTGTFSEANQYTLYYAFPNCIMLSQTIFRYTMAMP